MKKIFLIQTIAIMIFIASSAFAQGIYVGAGIGNTFFSSEFDDAVNQVQEISENSTAWKIFAGIQLQKFIGIEAGYRSFGTISSDVSDVTYESKTEGWDIEAVGVYQISIIDLFGKAGVMFSSTDESAGDESTDDSNTNFLWGLGVGAHFGPIGARLEWESIAVDGPTNLSMVSLSGTFGFGL
jgi:opacity protein-like surface antigen